MIYLTDAVKWAWGQAWLRQYTGELFHAILTDPPYHLTSINERFSGENSAPAKFGKDGAFGRLSRGFMGQAWDGGGVSFDPRTWAGFAECLHPGGFIVSFGGSRTYHRIAVAMEEAGLIIHPFVFVYAFGSGFPKATRIDTQVDRSNGLNRPDKIKGGHIGMCKHGGDINNDNEFGTSVPSVINKGCLTNGTPIHPLAKTWQNYRYGLQALKPAIEPIIVAQKPYVGRPVDCITSTGAGAWNIEAGRIETKDTWSGKTLGSPEAVTVYGNGLNHVFSPSNPNGRWPSNLILQHHPNCGDECADDCPVRLLGQMSGENVSSGGVNSGGLGDRVYGKYAKDKMAESAGGFGDSGTAARYFFQVDFAYDIAEQLANANPLFYTAKPGDNEREAGLEDLPDSVKRRVNSGGLENEPRFAPIKAKNIHPTVKPLSLTKYLASLLLPPPEYSPRRILVPFCGSGSEMIGAMLAGWDEVTGLEITPEYVPIAEARIKWWSQWIEWGQTDIDKILKAEKPSPNQQTLF